MFDSDDLESIVGAPEGASIPVTVLTGFLGSGKSTFLNKVFKDPAFKNALVIVNEFGEIGLDHLLIERPEENIVLLEGGCLCCEVRGDLVQTLADIYQRRSNGTLVQFDRIIIETTGLSNPVPIIQSILCDIELRPHYRLGKVITIVDSREIKSQIEKFTEAIEQVAVADLLLVSKMDIADHLSMDQLEALLRPINPGSHIAVSKQGVPENFNLKHFLGAEPLVEHTAFLEWLQRGEEFILSNQALGVEEDSARSAYTQLAIKELLCFQGVIKFTPFL
jgi:G3E family GTPase